MVTVSSTIKKSDHGNYNGENVSEASKRTPPRIINTIRRKLNRDSQASVTKVSSEVNTPEKQ